MAEGTEQRSDMLQPHTCQLSVTAGIWEQVGFAVALECKDFFPVFECHSGFRSTCLDLQNSKHIQ